MVYSPISGETTAMALKEVVRQWKDMTEVRGDDYGEMYAAAGQMENQEAGNRTI